MLVVAVVAGVSIKITKAKLDNIISYTYYMGYSTLRNVTGQMLGDFKSTDNIYVDKAASLFRFLELPVLAQEHFVDVYLENGEKKRGYYQFADPCVVKDWDCIAHIGQYGITSELCNIGKAVSYAKYVTKGNSYFWGEDELTFKVYNKLEGSGKLNAFYITYDPGWVAMKGWCSYLNDTGNRRVMHSCPQPDIDLNNVCEMNKQFEIIKKDNPNVVYDELSLLIISGEADDPDPTPEPTPNTCSNQPSEATIRTEYCQNQREWEGYPTCGYKPVPCNQDGYRWSKNSCACVPETATLPRKGANFCEKFLDYTNTKSTAEECNGDAIASNLTDFTDKKADIVLRNGLKLYNVRQNPAPLPLLAGNNQGGSYELADGTTVNVNEFGYTVYLDIDGEKGSSTLWEDVFPFYITMAGKVIPLYHTEGEKEYGGTSRQHLMTSVQKEVITTTGHRQVLWIRKSVPFKESACTSGYINSTTPYCSGVSLEPTCNEGANVCILKYVSPVKFF